MYKYGSSSEMEKDFMNNNQNSNTNNEKLKKVGPLPHLSTFHYEIESSGIPIIPKPARKIAQKKKEVLEKHFSSLHGKNTVLFTKNPLPCSPRKEAGVTLGDININRLDPRQSMQKSQLKLVHSECNPSSVKLFSNPNQHHLQFQCMKDEIPSTSNSCCFSYAISSQNSCSFNSVATSKSSDELDEQTMNVQQHQSSTISNEDKTRTPQKVQWQSSHSNKKSEILMLQQRRLNLLLWSSTTSKAKSEKNKGFGEQDDMYKDNLQSSHSTEEQEATETPLFFEDDEEQQWVEYWDEEVKANYYYNILTGEATWVVPSSYKSYT